MTQDDEVTKEHPTYPEAPQPADPVPSDAPPAETPATPPPPPPATPPPPPPATPPTNQPAVDPLEPTTTVHVVPTPPYAQSPNQGWAGPPPGAAKSPTQAQYQSPGYGQPGYAAPGYSQAQTWAAPTYGTSVMVALAAMLLVIGGVALAVLGAWLLTQGPALSDLVQRLRSVDLVLFKPTRETIRSVVSASPGALMVLGVLQLLIGAFVLGHRSWARWLGVLIGLLGLAFSIVVVITTMALVPGTSVQLIVAAAFLIVYALVVLVLIGGGSHFRAQYPRAR